jgi:serine/threonine-protein kinase
VALKVFRSDRYGHQEEAKSRFKKEAEILSRLAHPNFLSVFDIGEVDGVIFIATEFLRGSTLSHRMKGRPLTPDEAAGLLAIVARAMDHAHSLGIVHRDLKPANIMLTEEGTLKILDLGLALEVGETRAKYPSYVVGTPAYMAPEQARGEIGEIGPAADIYALGATLYDILVGQPPFRGVSTVQIIHDVLNSPPERPSKHNPAIPRELEAICLKCLEKEPGKRYRTAADLAADLELFRERWARRGAASGLWGRLRRLISPGR